MPRTTEELRKTPSKSNLGSSHSHYAFLWLPWMGSGGTTAVWQEANSKGRKSSNWKVWRCCLADRNGPSWCALLPSICWRLGQEQSQGSWPSHRVRGDSRAWGTSFYTWNGTRGLTAPCCTRGLLQMVHQHAPSHPSSYKRMGYGHREIPMLASAAKWCQGYANHTQTESQKVLALNGIYLPSNVISCARIF